MGEDNRKDFYDGEIDYSYVALISKKTRVGIIGGGKAGVIKTKHFINNKCYVEVLAKTFDIKLIELAEINPERLKLINDEFSNEFLMDKHIIIIALDDETLKNKIKEYCDENYKLYIDSSNFKDGMGVVPVERSTKNITFALNTKYGNPKGSVLLSEKVKNLLLDYDDFVEFTWKIRDKAKKLPKSKSRIVEFINSDDFKESFDKGEAENSLRMNFENEIVDYILDFNDDN